PGGLRAQRLRDAVQSRLAATQSTAGEDVIQVSGGAGRGRPAPSRRLRDAVGRPDIDMDAQPRGDALGPRGAETPIPDAPDAIRERGAELRSEETGALPRRVHGINLQRFAGKDNAP